MIPRPVQDELGHLADFQQRHQIKLVCLVCLELAHASRLKKELGDMAAARVFGQHEQVVRDRLAKFPGGMEVSGSGAGAHFLVFNEPSAAVRFALDLKGMIHRLGDRLGIHLTDSVAIHVGTLLEVTDAGREGAGPSRFNGLQADFCQLLLSIVEPGRVLLTRIAHDGARQALRGGGGPDAAGRHAWASHGMYLFEGFEEPVEVCEVAEGDEVPGRAPKGNDRVRPMVEPSGETEMASDPFAKPLLARMRTANGRERALAWRGAGLVVATGTMALMSGILDGWSYDLAYLLRPTQRHPEVLIVGMDDRSFRDLRQDAATLWNRSLHARLVDRLSAAGVRAIGFDVLFDAPGIRDTEAPGFQEDGRDKDLRLALGRSGRVVLAAQWNGQSVVAPSPLFRRGTPWGVVEQARDSASVIRERVDPPSDVSSFASALARVVEGQDKARPRGTWMNYYGPPGTIRSISYQALLEEGAVPDSVLSNKVVLVGSQASLPPARDAFPSPYSRWWGGPLHGVEANATSYLNHVNGDWLRRCPAWLELVATVFLGALAGWVAFFLEPRRAVVAGVSAAAGLGLALMAQVWQTHLWFPWLVFSLGQVPVAVTWSVVVRTTLMNEDGRRLRDLLKRRRSLPSTLVMAGRPGIPVGGERNAPVAAAAGPAGGPAGGPAVPDHEMLRCVGKGAYGEVWLARDIIGQYKAVKIIRRAVFDDPEPFEREFKGLQKFTPISRTHPGLVHVLHIGRNDEAGFIYYIMELGDDVDGGKEIDAGRYEARTLASDLAHGGPAPLRVVLEHGIQLGEALGHLHRHGLVHRDIKPANVIFVGGKAKLADIGLVRDMAETGSEVTLIGTPGYIPPEGHGLATADVFSLGKLLYVALTGLPVKSFPNLPEAMLSGPEAKAFERLAGVLLNACEPLAGDRLQSAGELVGELRAIQEAP